MLTNCQNKVSLKIPAASARRKLRSKNGDHYKRTGGPWRNYKINKIEFDMKLITPGEFFYV